MATNTEEIIGAIEKMTVLELAELVKALQDRFGVVAAAPAASTATAPTATTTTAAPVEEQTEFSVILTDFGANKINVIKVVRELTGLGLKEAKDLVEGVPKAVKEGVQKDEADKTAAKLKEAGAGVEIK